MAGGGRRFPRTTRSTSTPPVQISPPDLSSTRYAPLGAAIPTLPGLEQPTSPKHYPYPSNAVVYNDLFFEILMFFFPLIAGGLQYVHIYRSVWWLPNSYTNQTINFHLIDWYVVIFITTILVRRLLYFLGCYFIDKMVKENYVDVSTNCFKFFLFGMNLLLLVGCWYKIVLKSGKLMSTIYLLYPILFYPIVFKCDITPFFELINWCTIETPLYHACSTNPAEIRAEVENLKNNFNSRVKQILYSSVLNSYYAGLVPCVFAQNYVYYDLYWSAQHLVFIFISSMMGYGVHIFALRYCDIYHRSALHLGRWEKIDNRTILTVYTWQHDYLWPAGAIVRHGKDMYKSLTDCVAAEPGNSTHSKFHVIFKNPSSPIFYITCVHLIMILYQIFLILNTVYWYHILSIAFLLFFNNYTLFKMMRDYLVSSKIYRLERKIHEKSNLH